MGNRLGSRCTFLPGDDGILHVWRAPTWEEIESAEKLGASSRTGPWGAGSMKSNDSHGAEDLLPLVDAELLRLNDALDASRRMTPARPSW